MKLAIVGSQAKAWPEPWYAVTVISAVIQIFRPKLIISGASPGGGVDIWAAEVAKHWGIEIQEFPPIGRGWAAYKPRNIQIAEACDALVSIRSALSTTYGSGWTANYTERVLHKPAYRITL